MYACVPVVFFQAEDGQCVSRHLDNFSRKHQAPAAASVTGDCTSRSCSSDVCLELMDPLDQFLMLRKAPVSKGPVVTAAVTDGSSSLIAIVQPCVSTGWRPQFICSIMPLVLMSAN